jgi:hypothetical protein
MGNDSNDTVFSVLKWTLIVSIALAFTLLFLTVCAICGLIEAICNYYKSASINVAKENGSYSLKKGFQDLKNTVITCWKLNIETAKHYFEKSRNYDRKFKVVVESFLQMVGIFVVFLGTISYLVLCPLHSIVLLVSILFSHSNNNRPI